MGAGSCFRWRENYCDVLEQLGPEEEHEQVCSGGISPGNSESASNEEGGAKDGRAKVHGYSTICANKKSSSKTASPCSYYSHYSETTSSQSFSSTPICYQHPPGRSYHPTSYTQASTGSPEEQASCTEPTTVQPSPKTASAKTDCPKRRSNYYSNHPATEQFTCTGGPAHPTTFFPY